MCTCGSMKPGNTYLPAASMTSVPAARRVRPDGRDVSLLTVMSATPRSRRDYSPFLISRLIFSPIAVILGPQPVSGFDALPRRYASIASQRW